MANLLKDLYNTTNSIVSQANGGAPGMYVAPGGGIQSNPPTRAQQIAFERANSYNPGQRLYNTRANSYNPLPGMPGTVGGVRVNPVTGKVPTPTAPTDPTTYTSANINAQKSTNNRNPIGPDKDYPSSEEWLAEQTRLLEQERFDAFVKSMQDQVEGNGNGNGNGNGDGAGDGDGDGNGDGDGDGAIIDDGTIIDDGSFIGDGSDLELYQPDKFPWSFSGIDPTVMGKIIPELGDQLLEAMKNFDSNVGRYFQAAVDDNQVGIQDLLKGVLENSVNSLSSRGILNSSITADAIGTATGDVMKNVQNQNMQAGLEAAKMHLSKPNLLGDLMQLGQFSYQEDRSVPVRTLASLFV